MVKQREERSGGRLELPQRAEGSVDDSAPPPLLLEVHDQAADTAECVAEQRLQDSAYATGSTKGTVLGGLGLASGGPLAE